MTIPRGVVACAAMLVAGCAGHDDGEITGTAAAPYKDTDGTTVHGAPDDPSAQPDPGSPAPASDELFVALESCSIQVGPRCIGGYWVREVNTKTTWHVVLDLSQLGGAAIAQAAGGDSALILRGHAGTTDGGTGLGTFIAVDAWRGLPDVEPPAGDTIVAVAPTSGALTATPVNGASESRFETLSVADFAPYLVDPAWLSTRVLDHGALVSTASDGATLHADQIYVHLPDVPGPCRPSRTDCREPEVLTSSRDGDRCLVATGCVQPLACPLYQPACPPGYVLAAWPSLPGGCAAFACDAAFLGQ